MIPLSEWLHLTLASDILVRIVVCELPVGVSVSLFVSPVVHWPPVPYPTNEDQVCCSPQHLCNAEIVIHSLTSE